MYLIVLPIEFFISALIWIPLTLLPSNIQRIYTITETARRILYVKMHISVIAQWLILSVELFINERIWITLKHNSINSMSLLRTELVQIDLQFLSFLTRKLTQSSFALVTIEPATLLQFSHRTIRNFRKQRIGFLFPMLQASPAL